MAPLAERLDATRYKGLKLLVQVQYGATFENVP
jgi:hypothetical protein